MSDPAPTPAPPTATPAPAPALTDDQTSGRLFVHWNVATLIVGVVALALGWFATRASGQEPRAQAGFDPVGLAGDAGWDDGKAEVARYEAKRTIYGGERTYTLVRVVVKEPYDPAQGVKPDDARPGTLDALKVVASHEVPTGKAYDYRQTTFTLLDRRDPRRLLSLTMSSQEWCGNVFVRLMRAGGGLTRTAHSYWDGEADWSDALAGDVWVEDQLPFTIRALDPASAPLEVDLLPATLANRAPRTRPARARLEVEAADEQVTTPAGTFRCVRWVVRAGERVGRYWVAQDAPLRPLVRFEDATGAGALSSLERSAYWVAN